MKILTPQEMGRRGGEARAKNATKRQLKRWAKKAGKARAEQMTPEDWAEMQRKGVEAKKKKRKMKKILPKHTH